MSKIIVLKVYDNTVKNIETIVQVKDLLASSNSLGFPLELINLIPVTINIIREIVSTDPNTTFSKTFVMLLKSESPPLGSFAETCTKMLFQSPPPKSAKAFELFSKLNKSINIKIEYFFKIIISENYAPLEGGAFLISIRILLA